MVIEEIVQILLSDESLEIPCDAAETPSWPDTPGPAKWVASIVCPSCRLGDIVLICDDCKDHALNYVGSVWCNSCFHEEERISKWIVSLNPI